MTASATQPTGERHTTVHVLMGPPAAGKSFFARKLASAVPGALIVSSDDVRTQLYGNALIDGDFRQVFDEVYAHLQRAISVSAVVIYEATNVDPSHRTRLVRRLRAWGAKKVVGHCFGTPLQLCLYRNAHRTRVIPQDKLIRLFDQWMAHEPRIEEGFDELRWH